MDTQNTSMGSSRPIIENEDHYLARSKFESCEELVKSAREFYYTKGYGVSIRSSKKDKSVTLQCDRGGCYRDIRGIQDKRQKKTSSRLINCPFRIIGSKGKDGTWVYKPKDLKHNHEPSTDMSGHPASRQLPPDTIQIVEDMTRSGIPPRQILCSLRQQTPNILATSRTIYNVKKKIKRDSLGNRSVIGVLFEEFEKGGFLYDVLHDSEGHITSLFIVHPLSIKLAKHFSNAFVMDCTYKTNKFNMPLLDIVGMSCFNTSFYSGFAFLEREDEENYIWALNAFKNMLGEGNQPSVIISDRELALMNAIKNVFPMVTNLLCVWHIEKNVLAKCKKHFEHDEEFDIFMSSWNNVVYSVREAMFVTNWVEFELFYKDKRDALEYIKSTWLPWKEKFVSAWTEKWRIDTLSLNSKDALVYDGYSTFRKLLDELDSKYQVWPLNKKEFATSLIFNLINQPETLFEPIVQRPKGRPPKSKKRKGKTSTTREPSRFEFVESSRIHNPSSSACSFQISNDMVHEVSYGHHDNNSYDFNIYHDDLSSDIGQ